MFRFENIDYLYALILVPLILIIFYLNDYNKRKRILKFGDPELVRRLMIDVSALRPQLKIWFLSLALTCIIIACARPQFGTKIDTVERSGIEAIIAIDVSNSMLAEDVRPSRLDKAKMLVSNMVDNMTNDKIGLIVYAGQAFTQLPITNDYVSAKMFLDEIDPSMINVQGTDIATAIDLGSKSFTQKKNVSRAIFVITDGEDNEGGAVEAARQAAKKGIHVYVLGVGSPGGAHIPIPGTSQYIIDDQGNPVVSCLNEEMCRQISNAGDGAYIYVDNSSSAQEELNKYTDKLAKSKLESQIYSEYEEQYQGFLLLAILFLLLDVLILERENHILKSFNIFHRRAAVMLLLLCTCMGAMAQSTNDYVRRGNRKYRDSIYDKAQIEYQKGFQKDSSHVQVVYNLANTLLYQGHPKEAMRLYEKIAKTETVKYRRHMIYHNMGVILQTQKQFREAIECYKEALRTDPHDDETRYNYILCLRQLKNDNSGGGGSDDQNGENKDKDDKQQQQQQQQQDKKDQDKKDEQKQQQKPQQDQISKENAEQLLNAALQNERNTQDKVKKQQQAQPRRLQKQW